MRRAVWQPKSALRRSAARRTIILYILLIIIADELFLYVQQRLVMI